MVCSAAASVKHFNLARNEKKKAVLEALQAHYTMLVSLAGSLFSCLKTGLSLSERHGGPSCGGGGLSVAVVAARLLALVEGMLLSFGAKATKDVSIAIFGEAAFFVQHAVAQGKGQGGDYQRQSVLHEGNPRDVPWPRRCYPWHRASPEAVVVVPALPTVRSRPCPCPCSKV